MWLQLLLLLVIVVPDDTTGGTAVHSLPHGHFTQSGWNHAAWSRLQPELAQPRAQRIARDPESARRLGLVPASLAHRLLDDRFLPLPQIDPLRRQPGRGGGRGRDGRRFTRFARPGVGRAREGEVLHLECGTTTPQDGPLDHVAQLAHVPRPGVGPQQVPRSWPNRSASVGGAGKAGQLTSMRGFAGRGPEAWMGRASRPLPVPVAPVSSTGGVSSGAAICRARSSTARMAGDSPRLAPK